MNDVGAPQGVAISSADRPGLAVPSRGQIARWAVFAGVAAAAFAVAVTLSSGHVRYRWGDALFLADNIAGFSAAGAYWLLRRPRSLIGPALLVAAATWVLVSFQSADAPLVFSLAVLADLPGTLATFYVLLSFPTGRLKHWQGRAVMAVLLAGLALFFLPYVLFSPVTTGGHPLAECAGACPSNSLQVGSISAAALGDLGKAEAVAGTIVGLLTCVQLLRWFSTGTRPRRRALFWIVIVGVPYAALFALRQLTAFVIDAPPDVVETVRWALAGARLLLPWAFVASLLHAEVFAGGALERLVSSLERQPDAARWQREVAAALDDPSLLIGVWSAADEAYVGVTGTRMGPQTGRGWQAIDDEDGSPVAAILHDPALEDDPELLGAAATATLISLESGRMADEIREARTRLLAVGEEERRRLERDLQEGAAQRLVALRVKIGLMGETGEEEDQRLIAEIAAEIDAATDDLRHLAHGIYPPLLRAEGIASALRGVARRSVVPMTVHCAGVSRHAPEIESVVYFCCLDAIRGAAERAGPDSAITVRVTEADDVLRFAVVDTGRPLPARATNGWGAGAIRERLHAVDGAVDIGPYAGGGTTVTGEIPTAR